MVKKCCVKGCDTNLNGVINGRSENKRPCFKFPSNENLVKKWLRAIPAKSIEIILKNAGVCILHFAHHFIKTSNKNNQKSKNTHLMPGPIPTIFFTSPIYSYKTNSIINFLIF